MVEASQIVETTKVVETQGTATVAVRIRVEAAKVFRGVYKIS